MRPRLLLVTTCALTFFGSGVPAQSPDWLDRWLAENPLRSEAIPRLIKNKKAKTALTKTEAEAAGRMLWAARREVLLKERRSEHDAREIVIGDRKMPFWFKVFGEKPKGGRRLFISMHGGGGAPARVNDGQYENQKRLYQPKEGVYLVPRAPTNTWNLWHQGHIDAFFDRLITNLTVFEDVNPDRVYIMGYSAGGDGVYQLAPRMADRWAAAAMMAGHPNEARPDNLLNIGFTLHMGANDSAYKRNQVAAEWKKKLAALHKAEPTGYRHHVELHPGRGHWMHREDAVAVPWMAKFTRNPFPAKVIWYQDDVTQSRLYWLAVAGEEQKRGTRIVARRDGNHIHIAESSVPRLTLMLNDAMINLDQPVKVSVRNKVIGRFEPKRTVVNLVESLLLRDDPAATVSATLPVDVPPNPNKKTAE